MNETLKIVVPCTPPTVNHYMKYRVATMNGHATVVTYYAKDAKDWWKAITKAANGKKFEADSYEVAYVVYQGYNERGDVDNYAKCILDGLGTTHGAKVIDTDHKVIACHGYKTRDRENPRTEIFIRALGQLSLLDLSPPPMPSKDDW